MAPYAAVQNAAKTSVDMVQAGLKPHYIPDLTQSQKQLQIRIENTIDKARRQYLKAERNKVLHEIRRKALHAAESHLDDRAKEVEHLKNGAKCLR